METVLRQFRMERECLTRRMQQEWCLQSLDAKPTMEVWLHVRTITLGEFPMSEDPGISRSSSDGNECVPSSRLRRVSKIAAVTVLASAGLLLSAAGIVPLGIAASTAGWHLGTEEFIKAFRKTAVAKKLADAPVKRKELRHVGEIALSVVLTGIGTVLSLGSLYAVGVPFLIIGVETGVHAGTAFLDDLRCVRSERKLGKQEQTVSVHEKSHEGVRALRPTREFE